MIRQADGLRDVGLEDQTEVGDLAQVTNRSAEVGTELFIGDPADEGVQGGC